MEEVKKLPKNIRQIGEKDDMYRIYVEDYVHTFIKKLITSQDLTAKAGVLFGSFSIIENKKCYFISGAAVIDQIWSEFGELEFSDQAWEMIKEVQKTYFADSMICGWFIRESEESGLDLVSMKRLHRNIFFKESLMFLYGEEEFSLWIGAKDTVVSPIQGYYIYYESNRSMQEYMVSRNQKEGEQVEKNVNDEAARSFRVVMKEKKENEKKRKHKAVYQIAAAAAVVTLLTGIQIWRSRNVRVPFNGSGRDEYAAEQAGATAEKQSESAAVPGETVNQTAASGEAAAQPAAPEEAANQTAASEETVGQPVNPSKQAGGKTQTKAESTAPSNESGQSKAAAQTTTKQTSDLSDTSPQAKSGTQTAAGSEESTYTVKAGDTLISICVDHYGTTQMLQKLCEMNHISNANAITTGQKIELP